MKMLNEKSSGRYEDTIKFCDYWTIQFLKSEYCKELNEEEMWLCPYIILNFVESMYSYFNLTPNEWCKDPLEEWCFTILPKKVFASKSFFNAIPPVLIKFFSFLHDEGVIINDLNLKMGLFLLKEKLKKNLLNPII